MKEIPLTQGKVALVDDEDYYWLSRHKWCAHKSRIYIYGNRSIKVNGKQKALWMHRCIVSCPEGFDVDHIDRNTLNNQKSNLRICSRSGNTSNSRVFAKSTGFKGVHKSENRFRARIVHGGKEYHLGCYATPQEAARAYDAASIRLHGEFARTNKMEGKL